MLNKMTCNTDNFLVQPLYVPKWVPSKTCSNIILNNFSGAYVVQLQTTCHRMFVMLEFISTPDKLKSICLITVGIEPTIYFGVLPQSPVN